MTPISSSEATVLDRTAEGFRASAIDIGEAIACLTGGVRPQPSDLSRLCGSMRAVQTFLKFEADDAQASEDWGRMIVAEGLEGLVFPVSAPVALGPFFEGLHPEETSNCATRPSAMKPGWWLLPGVAIGLVIWTLLFHWIGVL
tara:strand:- start:28340 stop:28768 length:429 start_codon:yes stop_codon:yes gene_type:complete